MLAARPRSAAELASALRRKGIEEPVVDRVVEWCGRLGYVDDDRFAEEYIRGRLARNPQGRRRLEQELLARGIPRDTVKRHLDRLAPQEEEDERCLAAARAGAVRYRDLAPEVRKRRLLGYLMRRGFTPETALRAVAQVDTDFRAD